MYLKKETFKDGAQSQSCPVGRRRQFGVVSLRKREHRMGSI